MSTLFSDAFTRADGALGANWALVTGSSAAMVVSSNRAASNTSLGTMEQQGTTTYPNDHWAQLTLITVETATDNGIGPAVRMASGALTAYFAQCNTHEIKLYKCVAGSFTQLGTDAAAATANDVIYIEAQGTSILVKKNGTTIIGPITDSGIASGKAGMWCSQSAVVPTADDFLAGDFTAADILMAQALT